MKQKKTTIKTLSNQAVGGSVDVPRAHTTLHHDRPGEKEIFVAVCVSESCFSCMHQCFGLMFFILRARTDRAVPLGRLRHFKFKSPQRRVNLQERN